MTHVQTVKMKCRPLNDPKSVKICSINENRCWQWMNGACDVQNVALVWFCSTQIVHSLLVICGWRIKASQVKWSVNTNSFHSFTCIMRNDLIYMAVLLFSRLFFIERFISFELVSCGAFYYSTWWLATLHEILKALIIHFRCRVMLLKGISGERFSFGPQTI